ncbi:MAG TPA: VOC family protein [Pseudomonadales bacterium]|nr:VOC family protein [Pseudomonadales bacterium]
MFDHISSYATDYDATRRFYDAVLAPLGHGCVHEMHMADDPDLPGRRAAAYGQARGSDGGVTFWVIEVTAPYSPRHVAFRAADEDAVRAFHAAGLAVGAPDHGAPGLRPEYHAGYYGAFLLDPDGNNVEAVVHHPH